MFNIIHIECYVLVKYQNKTFDDLIFHNFYNHKTICADGLKSNDKSGLGTITGEEVLTFSSPEYYYIFIIETLAILKALEYFE